MTFWNFSVEHVCVRSKWIFTRVVDCTLFDDLLSHSSHFIASFIETLNLKVTIDWNLTVALWPRHISAAAAVWCLTSWQLELNSLCVSIKIHTRSLNRFVKVSHMEKCTRRNGFKHFKKKKLNACEKSTKCRSLTKSKMVRPIRKRLFALIIDNISKRKINEIRMVESHWLNGKQIKYFNRCSLTYFNDWVIFFLLPQINESTWSTWSNPCL